MNIFFQNVYQNLINNFTHDKNFIKTMLKGSKRQKSAKKWHFRYFLWTCFLIVAEMGGVFYLNTT